MLKAKPYHTLKSRLLAWLLVPLFVLSIIQIASIYLETRKTATDLYDKMLVSIALSISENALTSGGDLLTVELLELIRQTTNDKLYYKCLIPHGRFLIGYHDMPEPPGGLKQINNHIEFYDAEYLGQRVRVIAVSRFSDRPSIKGWSSTYVAQTLQDRNDYVLNAVSKYFIWLILLLLIVIIFLSVGVSNALRPMERLHLSLNARDINDLKPLETKHMPRELGAIVETINHLFERLSHQIQLTKRFLENASHQLRTPIAALTLQSDLAVRAAKTEESLLAATKIKTNVDRVARLAHQLLRLSYSESRERKNMRDNKLDLRIVAEELVTRFISEYPKARVTLSLRSAYTVGKEELIKEALINLLENAYKYAGEDKEITVSTRVENHQSLLEVCDQGPGIPTELRQLVTERFFRAQNNVDGSGLGLAIVKEIVIEHEGKMQILSAKSGSGACIRCWFPMIEVNNMDDTTQYS